MTRSYVGTDVREVLQEIARAMGRDVHIHPSLSGCVNVDLVQVPVDQALRRVLGQQPLQVEVRKLDGPSTRMLIVVPTKEFAEFTDQIISCGGRPSGRLYRLEFFLENVPSARAVEFLSGEYPEVSFPPHLQQNGFYAEGTGDDLLQIRRELRVLDAAPGGGSR